jgi:DNA helicase-2/ATP-dependent DNA helicase PcrA
MSAALTPGPELATPQRRVVFDSPSQAELLAQLRLAQPTVRYAPATSWHLDEIVWNDATPVWYWAWDISVLRADARQVLNHFVYPLVTSGRPYCVGFNFGSAELLPRELGLQERDLLDLEDIGTLLCSDALPTTFAALAVPLPPVCQTPIEEPLFRALTEAGIPAEPQAKVGPFRVDFLIKHLGRRIAVEADGAAFHEAGRDAERDAALKELGIEKVLRFSGSSIWRDAAACAEAVKRELENLPRRVHRVEVDADLDDSQQEAVRHDTGPARVLAPAGAGKTRTMVNRVIRLLLQGVAPSSILVLAFNKKAAEQLREELRAKRVAVSQRLNGGEEAVTVMTFHGFGYWYQQDVIAHRPGLEDSPRAHRQRMSNAVAKTSIKLDAKRHSDPYAQFLKALARVKNNLEAPEEITVEIESYGPGGNPVTDVIDFGPVFAAFQRELIASKRQTYDDQIYGPVLDLLLHPTHRDLMQKRFTYMLIDEYQDLNAAQLALVDILARPHQQVFVVGDDDQLIYGWRFARVSNILEFHQRMPPRPHAQTYSLSTNYRCARAIVESSTRLINHNLLRAPKAIQPKAGADLGNVLFVDEPVWADRASAMCEFLQTRRREAGGEWRRLAVLCRFKAQQPLVALALDRADIPHTPLLSYRVFTDAVAHLVRAYIQLGQDPEVVTGDQWTLLLNRPNRYLSDELVGGLAQAPKPWQAILERLSRGGAPRGLTDVVGGARYLQTCLSSTVIATELLQHVLKVFDLERLWSDQATHSVRDADEAGAQQVLDVLRMLATDYPSPAAFLAQWDELADKERSRKDLAEDTLEREKNPKLDQVVIGTIHAAKGREYHSVVLVDYSPDLSRMSDTEREEERRVLYVGVTRAIDSVLLTVDGSKTCVHPYVKELIAPAASGEECAIPQQQQDALAQETALRAEEARLKQDLAELGSGHTLRRSQEAVDVQRQALEGLKGQLVDKEREQARSGLGRLLAKLTGERGMVAHDIARLRQEVADGQEELRKAEDQTQVLRSQPEVVGRVKRSRIRDIEGDLAKLAAQQARATSRRRELELLRLKSC